MAFEVACGNSECAKFGKTLTLADRFAGKRLRCKGCGQPIATPGAKAGTNNALLLVFAGVAVVGVCLLLGGLTVTAGWLASRASKKVEEVAANDRDRAKEELDRNGKTTVAPTRDSKTEKVRTPADDEPKDLTPVTLPPTPMPPVKPPPDNGGHKFILPIEALGDRHRIEKVKVTRIECTTLIGPGITTDVTFTWHSPEKCRFDEKMKGPLKGGPPFPKQPPPGVKFPPGGPGGQEMFIIINGDKGYVKAGGLTKTITGKELVAGKLKAFALGLSNLHSLRDYKTELVDKIMVKQKLNSKVRVSKAGEPEFYLYFDADTNLLSKSELRNTDLGGLTEVYFSDYQETDGIKHWRRAEQLRNGSRYGELTVQRVQFMNEIDESVFAPPK